MTRGSTPCWHVIVTVLALATIGAPLGTAVQLPQPGYLLVDNGMTLLSNGLCDGTSRIVYNGLAVDYKKQFRVTMDDSCGLRPEVRYLNDPVIEVGERIDWITASHMDGSGRNLTSVRTTYAYNVNPVPCYPETATPVQTNGDDTDPGWQMNGVFVLAPSGCFAGGRGTWQVNRPDGVEFTFSMDTLLSKDLDFGCEWKFATTIFGPYTAWPYNDPMSCDPFWLGSTEVIEIRLLDAVDAKGP